LSGRNNDNDNNDNRSGEHSNTKRDGNGIGDSTWGDKDQIGRFAATGSFADTSNDSSRPQRTVEQDRNSVSPVSDNTRETDRNNNLGSSVASESESSSRSSRSERENRRSKPRQSTKTRSGQGEKSASTVWDTVKEPEIVGDDFGDLPKDINLTIEDLSKLIYSCFGGLASMTGDHWKVTHAEAKELAQAMKKLPLTKNNRLFKLIARNAPYLNFAMVAGSLLMPRVLISYYEYQARRQEIEENKARRANSQQGQSGNHQQDFSGANTYGVEREYNIIN
jgi:hypothetical protein